jgi:Bacterial Ig-like domain (group 1)
MIASAGTAAASGGIGVWVGYADSLHAGPENFPTPWAGSPNTVFEGCVPLAACQFDAGAVRIVNNTGAPVTVNSVAVRVAGCTFTGWAPAVLANGSELIITQTAPFPTEACAGPAQLDSSDQGTLANCVGDGIQPIVDITINGTTTSYTDSGQVLNTGGLDRAICVGNESTQWTPIGQAPCRGVVLNMAPPSQTHGVGTTATVQATFTNSCGQPLQNVGVTFTVPSGPNAGRTFPATTDANGVATITYSSLMTGTDRLAAAVINMAGTIPSSNTVTVTWVAVFAPGGGSFVISDLKDVTGGSVYWWGAQWWKQDHLRIGLAPAAFKGFEKSNLSPWCGQPWTTRPGNSPKPPRSVSSLMAVIVSSHITKRGSVISGNILHIVVVQTNPGYGPNPGHPGTGTIVATLC